MKRNKFQTTSTAIVLSDNDVADIEVLREGTFNHSLYGKLEITRNKLAQMVRNFKDNVLQREISYDFQHKPELGAVAWVKKLFTEERDDGKMLLKASVEFTKAGRESIESKQFRYFSTEFLEDFKDKETAKSYGPTVLGGGLTNRPFIPGLNPITFAEDGSEAEVFEEINMNLEELKKQLSEKDAEVKSLNEKLNDKGAKTDELQAQITKLLSEKGDLEKKIKEAEDMNLADTVKKLEEALKEKDTQIKGLQESTEAAKALSDKVTKLEEANKISVEENKKLHDRLVASENEAYTKSIDADCQRLLSEGIPPAMVTLAKQIIMGGDRKATVKLSETVKEGDKEVKKDVDKGFKDAIVALMEALPKDMRVKLGEETKSESKKDDGTEVTLADVEKYAQDNKVSYEDALLKFVEEGKIKAEAV